MDASSDDERRFARKYVIVGGAESFRSPQRGAEHSEKGRTRSLALMIA